MGNDRHGKVHLFAIALVFRLWNKPHYRAGTYQEDLKNNLKNVAIPGTGLALSFWVRSKLLLLVFVLVIYPLVCFIGGIRNQFLDLGTYFYEQLIHPVDWFALWRINCTLVNYHSGLMSHRVPAYKLEDKWLFLQGAVKKNIPVSDWYTVQGVEVAHPLHKSQSGKLFDSVTNSGDWIIQKRIFNSEYIADMLPKNAPLSTFRVMTIQKNPHPLKSSLNSVHVLSCVFRAGLQDSQTDHSSVLFDVDLKTGEIKNGTTNNHWYRVGIKKGLTSPWTSDHTITSHPDSKKQVAGNYIKEIASMTELVTEAHKKLLPYVPIAGWDVALTDEGILLLEVNLSCNFFRGSFDKVVYFNFVDKYFTYLDTMLVREDIQQKKFII